MQQKRSLIAVLLISGILLLGAFLLIRSPFRTKLNQATAAIRLEDALASDPFFKDLQELDPARFQKLNEELASMTRAGKSIEEIQQKVRQVSSELAEEKLKRASAAGMREYLTARLKFFSLLQEISPTLCYAAIQRQPVSIEALPKDKQAGFLESSRAVVRATLSLKETPLIPQDDNKAAAQLQQIYSSLSPEELAILARSEQKPPQTTEEKALFSRSMIHLYKTGLQLPDPDMVGVFRFIEELPADDRKSAP